MDIKVKIYIEKSRGEAFIGRGPVQLMEKIDRMGSIRSAASDMKMSYSKAHSLIRGIEESLGRPIVEKSAGGSGGGGTVLKPGAKKIIKNFLKLEKDIKEYARLKFRESGI